MGAISACLRPGVGEAGRREYYAMVEVGELEDEEDVVSLGRNL